MCNWEILDLTRNDCNGTLFRHPVILLRKTDLKNWAGVCVWNPHHHAHPPSSFSFPHACTPQGCKSRLCRVVCVAIKLQISDFQQITTFTLCKSETLRVYAHARAGGRASESVGVCATPPSTPIFYENCHSHTDSLPCPRLRLSVCSCDYCALIMRAW